MARTIRNAVRSFGRETVTDILGGVWLVTLLFSLLHLPAFIA